jgi:predicted PurR-regulated permease PerM
MQHIQQNGFNLGTSGLQDQVQALASNALSVATDVFGGIAGFIVVLVLALYLVIEDSAIKKHLSSVGAKGVSGVFYQGDVAYHGKNSVRGFAVRCSCA